ncbi:CRISPR-associated ring nuclease Csm6 [Sphaerotilus uruguayifluvii]|uniref:CRISPR-associated protein (TIGR02584 family) n=1 Tax=Sphaerotilus uruguayifluvii TaxID=2735897 RepID=A0ABX2G9B5_9BURK|nr:CRISPR-associated ring nuclease Csm6 [Leptothrix sp. C29]NRT58058.1 CRISPR-associated protein (TIGR02584 family) [Leptothrix sp. C29]
MTSASPQPPLRRVLVCVSGMTPAIVTETLYALVKDQDFVPDEIHVITTLEGRNRIRESLLAPQTGHFHAFLSDHLPGRQIRFDDSTLHLIGQDEHGQGEALADIQTDEDNRQAANTIYRVLRQLKAAPEWTTRLHASVAGGRKSMSFYMGQAFSLVATSEDRLSHVLVNAPFENVGEFFYPTPEPREFTIELRGPDNKPTGEKKTVSSADARVQLAELSAIKLGSMLKDLPPKALEDFDFAIRLAQATLEAPPVQLDFATEQVELLGCTIKMAPQEFMVLGLYALARLHERDLPGGAAFRAEDLDERLLSDLNGGREVRGRDNFKPVGSKILKRLREQVGPAAEWLTIESVRERAPHVKHSPSELRLPAACLTLKNANDWWRLLAPALKKS